MRRTSLFAMVSTVVLGLLVSSLPGRAQATPAAPAGGPPRVQPATATPCGTPILVAGANAGTGANQLTAVAAIAPNDVWAVGSYVNGTHDRTLVEHWNGAAWAVVASPNVGINNNRLSGVSGKASNDVWAVGFYLNAYQHQSLTEHWDGHTWSIVASPNRGPGDNFFNAVTAIAANDVWAVGSGTSSLSSTLIEHWNGVAWTIFPTPYGYMDSLHGIAASAANDIWAVGDDDNNDQGSEALLEHWNGSAWSSVSGLSFTGTSTFWGVAVVAATDVWAVGSLTSNGSTVPQTLLAHWDGGAWTHVPSPNVGSGYNALYGVAASASNDVWAVGQYYNGSAYLTLLEHWNGSIWSVVPSPNAGGGNNAFIGVAVAGTTDIWAVGAAGPAGGNTQTLAVHVPLAPPFTDIAGNPFQGVIANLYCRGVVEGYADDTFRPYANADRGTLARWVVNARGWSFNTTGGPHFSDVPPTDPLYPYVETAYNHGVLSGYGDGTFRPTQTVTRGQMSKMTVNAMGWPLDTSGGPHFRDVSPANPFYAQIETIYHHAAVSGYSCGGPGEPCPGIYFRWGATNTRGQLTKVLANAIGP